MKILLTLLLTVTGTINAQQLINKIDVLSGIDLHGSAGEFYLISYVLGAGQLTGLTCVVEEAPSGSPFWVFFVSLDGMFSQVIGGSYYYGTTWHILPENIQMPAQGNGSKVGDSFFIPLSSSFNTSMMVGIISAGYSPTYTGKLTCAVYRQVKNTQ